MTNSQLKEQLRSLVLNYMKAYADGDNALAEKILYDINTIKKLCPNCSEQDTPDGL